MWHLRFGLRKNVQWTRQSKLVDDWQFCYPRARVVREEQGSPTLREGSWKRQAKVAWLRTPGRMQAQGRVHGAALTPGEQVPTSELASRNLSSVKTATGTRIGRGLILSVVDVTNLATNGVLFTGQPSHR